MAPPCGGTSREPWNRLVPHLLRDLCWIPREGTRWRHRLIGPRGLGAAPFPINSSCAERRWFRLQSPAAVPAVSRRGRFHTPASHPPQSQSVNRASRSLKGISQVHFPPAPSANRCVDTHVPGWSQRVPEVQAFEFTWDILATASSQPPTVSGKVFYCPKMTKRTKQNSKGVRRLVTRQEVREAAARKQNQRHQNKSISLPETDGSGYTGGAFRS